VLVETKALEMGHARALLTLAPQAAIALARQAAENGWSVREVEHRAQLLPPARMAAAKPRPSRSRPKPQADIAALERELSESLSTQVNVLHGRGGQGPPGDPYSDLDSLDGVLERLRTRAE
jgi:ParB family chromosome partitioning protein